MNVEQQIIDGRSWALCIEIGDCHSVADELDAISSGDSDESAGSDDGKS